MSTSSARESSGSGFPTRCPVHAPDSSSRILRALSLSRPRSVAPSGGREHREAVLSERNGGVGQRPRGRPHLQRLAAGHAGGGDAVRTALPHGRPGGNRHRARSQPCWRSCSQPRSGARLTSTTLALVALGVVLGFPLPNRPSLSHHVTAASFGDVRRDQAGRHRAVRRPSRGRAPKARLLAVLPRGRGRRGGVRHRAGRRTARSKSDILMSAAILLRGRGYGERSSRRRVVADSGRSSPGRSSWPCR